MELSRRGFFGTITAVAVGAIAGKAVAPSRPHLIIDRLDEPVQYALGTFHRDAFSITWPDRATFNFEPARIGETIKVRIPKRFTA